MKKVQHKIINGACLKHCTILEWGKTKKSTSFLFIVLLFTLLLNLLVVHANTAAFAHDDLAWLESYKFKVSEEGRWINYMLFPCIKLINGHICQLLEFICLFFFSYTCARNILDKSTALLLSLCAMLIPSFSLLIDWPATTLPMTLLLALAAIHGKSMNKALFFIIYGILFGGVIQSAYMLLPLLFLNEPPKNACKIILFWIVGYVLGFIISEIATYYICGSFIKLAQWRNPHYATNFSSLLENIQSAGITFSRHIRLLSDSFYLFFVISLPFLFWNYRKDVKRAVVISLLFFLIIFSCYAQSIPAGVIVATRTALCLHLGILFFVATSFINQRFVVQLLIIILGSIFFIHSTESVSYHNLRKNRWIQDFKAISIKHADINCVVMLSRPHDFKQLEQEYKSNGWYNTHFITAGAATQWRIAPFSQGIKNVLVENKAYKYIKQQNINFNQIDFKVQGELLYAVKDRTLICKLHNTK